MRLDEESLARLLSERAATLRTSPDLDDLAGRLAAHEARARRRHRAALAAAVVVVATSIGGIVGSLTGHGLGRIAVYYPAESHPRTTLAGGRPPGERSLTSVGHRATTPAPRPRPAAAAWRTLVARTTASGLAVVARTEATAPPVAVATGGHPLACLGASPVEVEVAKAGLLGGGDALAGIPPLSPDGLAVVGSGQFGQGSQAGWWAVVESGSAARTVAGEYGSAVDETSPAGGISVLAGLTSAGAGQVAPDPYASAVASGRNGEVLSSIAFRLAGSPVAIGIAPSGGSAATSASRGCPVYGGGAGGPAVVPSGWHTALTARSTLTAAASVVEAFVQAYTPDPVFGYVLNAGAVSGGPLWPAAEEGTAPRPAGSGGGNEAALPGVDVAVYEVDFVKPDEAVVAYRLRGGALETGTAVGEIGTAGRWLVSRATFCADSALTEVRCR